MNLRSYGNALLDSRDPLPHLLPAIGRETDAQRWLRQNSAAIRRAHDDMLADQSRFSAGEVK